MQLLFSLLANGNLQVDPEIRLPSPGMDVSISYFYNSWASETNPYGFGRTISTNLKLIASQDMKSIRLIRGDGSTVTYVELTPGKYGTAGTKRARVLLHVLANVWIEKDGKGKKTYYPVVPPGEESKVSRIVDSVGNCHRYDYGENGLLATLTDAVGRQVKFRYNEHGLLSEIDDWADRKTTFEYDTTTVPHKPCLAKVIGPTGCKTIYEHNVAGYLVGITDPNGYKTSYRYDDDGRVAARVMEGVGETQYHYDFSHMGDRAEYIRIITDPLGNKTTEVYSSDNDLKSTTSPMGLVTSYESKQSGNVKATLTNGRPSGAVIREQGGRVVTKVDAQGLKTVYTYDQFGNLLSKKLPTSASTQQIWGFPGSGFDQTGEKRRLQAEIDMYGNRTDHTYNVMGLRISSTDSNGNVTKYIYDRFGNLARKLEPTGAEWEWLYDAAGNVVRQTAPDGGVTKMEYDARNRVTKHTDPIGAETQIGYDGNGNKVLVIDALGNRWKWKYNVWDKPSIVTTPMGRVSRIEYDALGRITARIDAAGAKSSVEYDADGRQVATTDAMGNKIAFEFDGHGNVVSTTDSLGRISRTVYDDLGRVVEQVDALGNRRHQVFDSFGYMVETVDPDGNKTSYVYDDFGHEVAVLDPLGNKTQKVYDNSGRLVAEIDALGGRTSTVYGYDGRVLKTIDPMGYEYHNDVERNAAGRVVSTTDRAGRITRTEYDLMGREIASIDSFGSKTSTLYDAVGRVIATIDAYGGKTSLAFNADGREVSKTNALGHTTRFEYDEVGRRTGVIDALGNKTTFVYDKIGRLIQEVDANGNATSHEYDRVGNRITTIKPDGSSVRSRFDELNRQRERHLSSGQAYAFEYNAQGQITSELTEGGNVRIEYGATGRPNCRVLASGKRLLYEYDANGRRTSLTDHDLGITRYSYNAAGQLKGVTDPTGAVTSFDYDDMGKLCLTSHANGVMTSKSFDSLGREKDRKVIGKDGRILSAFASEYDRTNRRISLTEHDGTTTTYTYDALGQLTSELRAGSAQTWNLAYTYDAVGNRASKTENGVLTRYDYGACNELRSEVNMDGHTSYTYDRSGQLCTEVRGKSLTRRTWDSGGRLVSLTLPEGATETYKYDANGLRVAKTSGSTEESYIHDGVNVIAQIDEYGRTTASWTHAIPSMAGLLSERRAAITRVFGFDPAWNTRIVTDDVGAVASTYYCDAFGKQRASSGSNDTPHAFGGEVGYWQDATDRIYVRARHFAVESGRWISRDPIGFMAGDWNLYRYVGNQAGNAVDPLGLDPSDWCSINVYTPCINTLTTPDNALLSEIELICGVVGGLSAAVIYAMITGTLTCSTWCLTLGPVGPLCASACAIVIAAGVASCAAAIACMNNRISADESYCNKMQKHCVCCKKYACPTSKPGLCGLWGGGAPSCTNC